MAGSDSGKVMVEASDRLLGIYLADHLAAGAAGLALARRSARSNVANETGQFLRRLVVEIEEDHKTLQRVVAQLGFGRSRLKEIVARTGEKVGRLKLNGQLRGYSPLSRLLELETLSVGITGKLSLWQSLEQVPQIAQRLPGIDLGQLAERAQRQRVEVDEHRIAAARRAFA
ncbi:MAG TPA: hypothetical protein VNJ04_16650 [Gemmatimonadaceae bacterium]|nr:hypothetical protein [Gemmatimonadaceae bacterium]